MASKGSGAVAMNDIEVREADENDFLELFGEPPPDDPWLVMVGVRDGRILGGGGLTWANGYTLGFFHVLPGAPAVAIHREVLRFLKDCSAAGIGPILVGCDEAIPGAARWLERLGFAPDGEHDGMWSWLPSQR